MDFIISPYKSCGPLEFGMSRTSVRHILGNDFEEFKKTPLSKTTTDAYDSINIHIFYDEHNLLNAIEFWEGSNPILDDVSIFSLPATAILELLKGIDDNLELGFDIIISKKYGVSIYSIDGFVKNLNPLDSILVFSEDYYKFQLN